MYNEKGIGAVIYWNVSFMLTSLPFFPIFTLLPSLQLVIFLMFYYLLM